MVTSAAEAREAASIIYKRRNESLADKKFLAQKLKAFRG